MFIKHHGPGTMTKENFHGVIDSYIKNNKELYNKVIIIHTLHWCHIHMELIQSFKLTGPSWAHACHTVSIRHHEIYIHPHHNLQLTNLCPLTSQTAQ